MNPFTGENTYLRNDAIEVLMRENSGLREELRAMHEYIRSLKRIIDNLRITKLEQQLAEKQ